MGDEYLYKETVNPVSEESPMTDKNMYMILDQNGGSYNGQILFDTSIVSNSGQWCDWSSAYIQVPFVCTFQSSTDVSAAAAYVQGLAMGLKNGYYQIVDSIQVDYNNTNVVQLQPFTNFYVNYKLMSTMSADDLKKWGPSIGFSPDTATTSSFANAANANGDGHSNNVVNPAAGLTYASQIGARNEGLLNRLQLTGYQLNTRNTGYGGVPQINSTALANQIGKNYQVDNNGAAAGRIWQWNILCTIRLKDLSDWFDKLPLVKGAFMRITINYNSARATVTSVAAGPTMVTASLTQLTGRTNPLILSSSLANNPLNGTVANGAGGTFSVSCGVAACTTPNSFQTPQISQCRLYVPAFSLNPLAESQLISLKPEREVRYYDLYNYNFGAIPAGNAFNQILTNGIVNPKYVVVMPFLTGTAANTGLAVAGNVYQSVFDPAPGCTTPLAAITQFQVQVGGMNMFQQNVQYDFSAFLDEVAGLNAINGGISTGLTNGLIGHLEWDNLYRYYVCDVSRRSSSEDNVPKSIVVQGINNTSRVMDYICFVVFERKVNINMVTGAIIP